MTNIFFANDIYTSSGSVTRFGCFPEQVAKYQASSFYNFEEDNLPIYDLEERTFANWERLGYYSSSIPGLALTVSADAPSEVVSCSSNIFNTLSAAITSLPVEINFPVLIEVGSFGALGDLVLDSIKFGPRGSLEIINRCFSRGLSVIKNNEGGFVFPNYTESYRNTGLYSQYRYVEGIADIGTDYGIKQFWNEASCVHIQSPVLSSLISGATKDPRMTGNINTITQIPGFNTGNEVLGADSTGRRPTILTVDLDGAMATTAGVGSITNFEINPFESDQSKGQTFVSYDASCYNTFDNTEILRDIPASNDLQELNVVQYGNKLNKIVINHCNGPIYIRNFFVDSNYSEDAGVEIDNSEVWLETITSVRNKKYGFYINNSKVTAARGMVAYRNYGFNGAERLSGKWAEQAVFDTPISEDAAGLRLVNSEMTVSSTSGWESTLGATSATSGILDMNHIWNFSRNTNGIVLENSTLKGGQKAENNSVETFAQSFFSCEFSTNIGLICKNSVVDLFGRLDIHNNTRGILASNSDVTIDQFGVESSQREGIKLVGSNLKYGKSLYKDDDIESITPTLGLTQFIFSGNGQHLVLDCNSTFMPINTSSMEDHYSEMRFFMAHGMNSKSGATHRSPLPAISVDNGSKAILLHAYIRRRDNESVGSASVKGLAIEANSNSKVILRGSKSFATRIKGPDSYTNQKRCAGLYAGKGSTIEVNGPTVITDFGIDALGEDNSTICFKPVTQDSGVLDLSSFDVTNKLNHTAIELHSTRACVVVNRNSVFTAENLGDFSGAWGQAVNGQLLLLSGTDLVTSGSDGLNIAPFIDGGSLQFYPNPNDDGDYALGGKGRVGIDLNTNTFTGSKGPDAKYKQYLTGDSYGPWDNGSEGVDGLSALTAGGTCVRALGNSIVNVKNVVFPCGWWNPSGIYYDSSGDLCDQLFIWNIADGSQLKSSFVSVSGAYPTDVGYFGPSSVWNATGTVAYNAFSGTPDSSSLSILDTFGIGPSDAILPTPAATLIPLLPGLSENQGPFRIFFGASPAANYLANPDASFQGMYQQVFAQGYNPSGNLQASPAVSSVFPELLRFTDNGQQLSTSGWYSCSAMLVNDSSKALLDESSSNLFANAKHVSTGRYGIPKMVTIYRSNKQIGSEGATNASKLAGRGFKSTTVFDLDRDV